MLIEAVILLFLFQVKHFIADYPLQFPFMYMNKGARSGWVLPLAMHSMVHAVMTALLVAGFAKFMLPTVDLTYVVPVSAVFDFTTHFITDRWKATRKGGPDTSKFWIYLGIDQFIHHVVGIQNAFYVWMVIVSQGGPAAWQTAF